MKKIFLIYFLFFFFVLNSYCKENSDHYLNILKYEKISVEEIESLSREELEKRAWFFLSYNLFDTSTLFFQKLLQTEDSNKDFNLGIAYSLKGKGRFKEAEYHFKKVYEDLKDFSGEELFKRVDKKEKEKHLKKIEELTKKHNGGEADFTTVRSLMELNSYVGNWDSSTYFARKALGYRDDYLLKVKLAEFYLRSKRYREGESLLKELLNLYPEDPYLLTLLSVTYFKDFEYKKSEEFFRKAKEISDEKKIEALAKNILSSIGDEEFSDFIERKRGEFGVKLGYYENSSNVIRESLGEELLIKHRGNIFKIIHQKDNFFKKDSDSIGRDKLSFDSKVFLREDTLLFFNLALNHYNNNTTTVPFGVSLGKSFGPLYISLSYDQYDICDTENSFGNLLYNYASDFGATKKNVRTKDSSVFLLYENEKVFSFIKVIEGEYSDGNNKSSRIFEIARKQFLNKNVSVGYTYFYLNFKDQSPLYFYNNFSEGSYYDPVNFEVHSLYLKGKLDYDRIAFYSEIRGSYIPKTDGWGELIDLGIKGFFGKNHSINLSFRQYSHNKGLLRNGEGGIFWAKQILVGYSYRF